MTSQRIAVSLLLGWVSLAGVAADCPGTRCTRQAVSPPPPCTPSTGTPTHIELPDSVWQAVQQGLGQRLLVTLDVTDLSTVSRTQQLTEYERRKQTVLQALPREGVGLLRSFEQLPLLEIEVNSEPALRALLLHCLVEGVFVDREERTLTPRGAP